jgi:hypothetical protein
VGGVYGQKKEDTERLKGDPGAFRRGKKPKIEIARYSPASRFVKALKNCPRSDCPQDYMLRSTTIHLLAKLSNRYSPPDLCEDYVNYRTFVNYKIRSILGRSIHGTPCLSFLLGWYLRGSLESIDYRIALLLTA